MLERIKDFLYDLSDIIISLAIVAVILFVITWKLNDAMPDSLAMFTEQSEQINSSAPVSTINIDLNEEIYTPRDQVSQSSGDEVITTSPPEHVDDVVITIPNGSTGQKIAAILKNNQLIDDETAFLHSIEKMGLANRLRAGSYKLSANMTDEEIINILSGN